MHGTASQLIMVGIAAAGGLYLGKAARLTRLPSLIGYMVFGAIIGLSGLHLLDESALEDLAFITELALGFVAFAIGAELSVASLKRQGTGVVSIILAESFGAFLVVLAGVYAITRDFPLSLMFAAVAPASAPAGTVAVIQEYKAKGSLTKMLYAVVGFDDALAIMIYAFAAAVAGSFLAREAGDAADSWHQMLSGAGREIGLSLVIGGLVGLVFNMLVYRLHSPGEVVVLVFGTVTACVGLSLRFQASFILSNMLVGFILSNTRREETVRRVMAPVAQFMPLLFVLFFCLAGAHLDFAVLRHLGLLGVVYILCRSAGLIGGSRLGAVLGGAEKKIKNYVGLGILSQAGVAIGLSLIAKQQFDALGSKRALMIGGALITTVTATSIIFEVVGPILTKIALQKAGEIGADEPVGRPRQRRRTKRAPRHVGPS
jgi:Kef-type K+ transport system membrane component KefB